MTHFIHTFILIFLLNIFYSKAFCFEKTVETTKFFFNKKTEALETKFLVKVSPEVYFRNSIIFVHEISTSYFFLRLEEILLDGKPSPELLVSKTNFEIILKIPESIEYGLHTFKLIFADGYFTEFDFEVIPLEVYGDDSINPYDPDPRTQNGSEKNIGDVPPKKNKHSFTYPNGGLYKNSKLQCDAMHVIDGKFTIIEGEIKEWLGIIPIRGRFSNLYLDFCSKTKTMYVMNDWFLGKGDYDSNSCYNRFEFMTAGGKDKWIIKVYHSIVRGIEVYLNGKNVTNDTNIVVGGAFGYGPSLLDTTPHTLYEFGIRTESGIFFFPGDPGSICDPYIPPKPPQGQPSVKVICDEYGVEGYGLISEPTAILGYLGDENISTIPINRYFPISGIQGLVREPQYIYGIIEKDKISFNYTNNKAHTNNCQKFHIIDGEFTKNPDQNSPNEWESSLFAEGRYSRLYADVCDTTLYILNDWYFANEEPSNRNCYNVFEIWTGNGAEHWAVWVYFDPNKKIRVYRNGLDVSNDSNYVLGGAYGFSTSPKSNFYHTIYEFAIKVMKGSWFMAICDPGPMSFCDDLKETPPRKINARIGFRDAKNPNLSPGDLTENLMIPDNNIVELIFGTNADTKEWFLKKYKVTIEYDPITFFPLEIIPVSTNFINNNVLSFNYKIYETGKVEIECVFDNFISGNGDFFKLVGIVSSNNSITSAVLRSKFDIFNRTSNMYYISIPDIKYEISLNTPNSQTLEEKIFVYPNPTSGYLNIVFVSETEDIIDINIFDVQGRIVFSKANVVLNRGFNKFTLECNSFSSSEYFIVVSNKVFIKTIKFNYVK